jgi:RimJ/RimL family protein N-acetyltransferase
VITLPIVTERLVIREWSLADEAALAQLFGDPDVVRYIAFGDHTTQSLIERYLSDQQQLGFAFYALCTREGEILGEVGFHVYEPTGEPELGWALVPRAWGKGYATEGARACIEALFAQSEHERILAQVDLRNARSLRTAERIGMRPLGEIEHRSGNPHMLFEVRR